MNEEEAYSEKKCKLGATRAMEIMSYEFVLRGTVCLEYICSDSSYRLVEFSNHTLYVI